MLRRHRAFPHRFAGAALFIPALAAASSIHAQSLICEANAVPCCRFSLRDNPTKQVAPNFGVQIWPKTLTQPEAVEQLKALRPSHLRFALGPNWRREPALNARATDAELDDAVAAGFDHAGLNIEIGVLRELKRSTGASLDLVIWEPPPLPSEIVRSPTKTGRKMQSLDTALAARFAVSVLRHIARQGLMLDGVELSNEPDGDWNIRIEPRDYLAFVKAVRSEANRRRLSLPKIYGPATSSIATLRAYLREPSLANSILDSVDVLSVHGWDNPGRRDRFVELDALFDDLRRLRRKPELAITENGLARPIPSNLSDAMNLKKRTPDSIANTEFFGSLSARDLLRFYARGVGTIIQWEFRDESWGKASFGLIDEAGRTRPIYRMLRQLSEYLSADRPDRVDQTTTDGLFIAHRGGRDTLWSANVSDAPMTLVFADGTRALVPPRSGLTPCRPGAEAQGFVQPPWSLVGITIAKP